MALFAATCAYVIVWRRSLAELALVAAPFVAGVAAVMLIGGGGYRANVLDAPRLNPLIPYLAFYWYRGVAVTNLLPWGISLYAIVALARPGSVHGPLRSIAGVAARSKQVFGADLTYPALATLAAFCAGAVLLAKVGSALNHVIELNVAGSLLCAAVLGSTWETPKARAMCAAGALMLLPMIAFDAALLLDAGRVQKALLLKSWGVALHLTTPDAARTRQQLESIVSGLPHPIFTDDALFAPPWHATGNRYPTVILDRLLRRGHARAHRARRLRPVRIATSPRRSFRICRRSWSRDARRLPAARTVPIDGGEPLRIRVRDR